MADVFISYAREDRDAAERLAGALEREGWSIWWDRHIEGGAAFARAIEQELNASKAVIVVWSAASVQSDWVKDEAATARDQGKLVAISLDGTAAPLGFKQYHAIDLSGWGGDAASTVFRDLARSVEARMQGSGPVAAAAAHDTASVPVAPAPARKRTWFAVAGVVLAMAIGALLFMQRSPEPGTGPEAAGPRPVSESSGPAASPAATPE